MSISPHDYDVLRTLAGRYSEIAQLDAQKERLDRYRRTVSLERVRPVVLIDEVPWGEFDDDALVPQCEDASLRGIERRMRRTLYQWDHFQADQVVPPVWYMGKVCRSTGIGLSVEDKQIGSDTGSNISAHEYVDKLKDEQDLKKIRLPELSYDEEATHQNVMKAERIFNGLMPVEAVGGAIHYNMWDDIARFRGVDHLLMDLAMRPDFMHQVAQRFMEIGDSVATQREELGLLDYRHILVHGTVAATSELPSDDYDGKAKRKDVWGRCSAQIFGSVSPDMHDEFDLAYNQKIFGDCGLVYYGCCEPMHNKIDILRKRFKNLRKVSITPWADPDVAAKHMGNNLVMAAKPNPAFVAPATFNPEPVKEEIRRYLDACDRHQTPCEFVLKDISTIAKHTETLTRWVETVSTVVDEYFG